MSRPAPPVPPGRRSGPPGEPAGAPSKREQRKQQAKDRKEKRAGSKIQLVPTLVMLALIVAAAVVYLGVRSARVALTPQDDTVEVTAEGVRATFAVPSAWKVAEQDGVSGGVSRYAAGPAGAREDAMFITRYPLAANPAGRKERRRMLQEAEASLQATGAGKLSDPDEVKVDGRPAWRYRFKHQRLAVTVHLVLREDEREPTLYQLSCQSRVGAAGKAVRDGCETVISTFRISD